MNISIFEIINVIKIIVLVTFIISKKYLSWNNIVQKNVILILALSLIIELINSIFMFYKLPIGIIISFYTIINFLFWILLLSNIINLRKEVTILILFIFFMFSSINLFIFEGLIHFNYQTFVFGSFIYLSIFICSSFKQLQNEKLSFFQSNNYLLLCAPVLFFIGLSFMFGFKSKALTSYIVFGNIKLYTFISYFVNIIYYIYRERKLQNAT
jgi:hypothetical protein